MKNIQIVFAFAAVTLLLQNAQAYDIETHVEVLTRSAASQSILQTDPAVLRNLGLDKSITDATQRFPNSGVRPRTIPKCAHCALSLCPW